mgnify:CR=1 FL=1
MNLEVVGKDLTPSKMIKGRIESKLSKLEKRLGQNLFIRVRLENVSAQQFSCGIHFQNSGQDYSANSVSDDLVKAADEAIDKIARQVGKAQHRPESFRKGGNSIRESEI